MHIRSSIFAAACLSIPVSAFYPYTYGESPPSSPKRSPRSQDIAAEDQTLRSVTLPLRRVPIRRENKYNIVNSNDPKQENSIAIDQDGTDLSYMVAVTIGSSKEEYHLLLDSAASNTWVMGQDCKSDACGTHNTFGDSDSSSIKKSSTPFSVTYGTGSVSGITASDTFHLSSLSPNITFGLATNVSSDFNSYPMDGIMGVGRGDNVQGTIEAPSVMDALADQKLIKSKLFGIHISRSKDGKNDGELNFGEPNKDRYDGDLNWNSLAQNNNGFWEIGVDDAGVDGKKLGLTGRQAILDSGTSFILMPSDDAKAVHNAIPGSKQNGETFTVPCKSTQVVQMTFNKQTYNISTADYIAGDSGDGNCKSNIIGRQTFGDKEWLVGDVFLKNAYAVFDFDNSRVGLGIKSSETTQSVSSSAASSSGTATTQASGSPATATKTSPAGGNANPTAESQQTAGASPSAKGASRAAYEFSSCMPLLFMMASVFLMFI